MGMHGSSGEGNNDMLFGPMYLQHVTRTNPYNIWVYIHEFKSLVSYERHFLSGIAPLVEKQVKTGCLRWLRSVLMQEYRILLSLTHAVSEVRH